MKPLYKSSIVIWSEFEPSNLELESLAREASVGEAYCSRMQSKLIENPTKDPDWDGTEFFGVQDDTEILEIGDYQKKLDTDYHTYNDTPCYQCGDLDGCWRKPK